MVMRDPDVAVKLMRNLRAMGVHLTIDDFGTGYSSLGYLKLFPINNLKGGQELRARPAAFQGRCRHHARVIAMAHSLEMNVIAEGVELREQLDVLRTEGCDEFPGLSVRPPLAEEDLIRFIRDVRHAREAELARKTRPVGAGVCGRNRRELQAGTAPWVSLRERRASRARRACLSCWSSAAFFCVLPRSGALSSTSRRTRST